jgi:hypothetical protein
MEKQLSQARKDLLSLERSLARKEALLLEALPRIKNGAVLDDLAERIERHLGER